MSVVDDRRELLGLLDGFDLVAFGSKIAEYRRGGLPAQSMSDGRGGREGIGGLDKMDKKMRRAQKLMERGFRDLVKQAQTLAYLHDSVLVSAPPVTADPEPDRVPCANLRCLPTEEHPEWGFLDRSRLSGECGKCRVHRHRYGLEWPDLPNGFVPPLCDNKA
jgi:hypothetical protein